MVQRMKISSGSIDQPSPMSRKLLGEYRVRIKIDEHNLQQELISHPDLGREINDQYKLAISHRDAMKHELEIEEAEFDKEYRGNSSKDRVTDKEIRAEASLDSGIQGLERDLREWSLIVGYWENLSVAVKDRGYMLSKLVELYMSDYFGDVTGRGERAAIRDKLAAESRDEQTKRRRSDSRDTSDSNSN